MVKPYDRLVIDKRYRRRHQTPLLKFVQGRFIAAHVALLKWDPVLRKKLFRPVAEHSAWLSKDDNFRLNPCVTIRRVWHGPNLSLF